MARSPLLWDGRALLDADRLIRAGVADRRTSFELAFAELPRHTGFLVVAGVEAALDALARSRLGEDEVEAARRACGFGEELARRLAGAALTVDIDAVPDGTLAFAGTPVATVEGPFVEAVLVGALLAPAVRRGTAAATRAARLHIAADGGAIIDGSSARAPWAEEALAIARAAHVGGAAATTSALAATVLGIPFRGEATLDLGALAPPAAQGEDSWGTSSADRVVDLGGDDEEALLLEARRVGTGAGGWVASGLVDSGAERLPVRYELVAIEEAGAWSLRRGTSDRGDVIAGRKMVARYHDVDGRSVADVVHLAHERMQAPRSLGAVKLAPLARAVMRGGRALEAVEPASAGRERSVAARRMLPWAVTNLRAPARYPVHLSPALLALREPAPGGDQRSSSAWVRM
jgi:nicotinate phosphoribosyltransferase